MARFVHAPLGKFRGALGDALFRKIHGNFLVGVKPDSFTAGTDDAAVKRRQRFSLSAKFATAVNHIPVLKTIWDINTPDTMSAFNGILKADYPRCTFDDVTEDALLCPAFNAFNITPTTKTLEPDSILLTISPIGSGNLVDPAIEKEIRMSVVVFCKSPADADLHPDYYLYSFESAKQTLNITTALTFEAVISAPFTSEFDWYNVHRAFMVLTTYDIFGKVVNYSYTVNTQA